MTTYQRIFNKANIEDFNKSIKNLSWNTILNELNDPNKAYKEFLQKFTDVYETNFPLKKIKNRLIKKSMDD